MTAGQVVFTPSSCGRAVVKVWGATWAEARVPAAMERRDSEDFILDVWKPVYDFRASVFKLDLSCPHQLLCTAAAINRQVWTFVTLDERQFL